MGRIQIAQQTFTKGEFDPDLSERVDLQHYYASAAAAPNSVFHPQGGVSDRGGFQLVSHADILAAGFDRRLRRPLVPVTLSAGMITAQNAGSVENLLSQDVTQLFTTNQITDTPFVLCEVDLGAVQAIDAIDVAAIRAHTAKVGASETSGLVAQYWSGSAWITWGYDTDALASRNIKTSALTRRFSSWPGSDVAARFWRLVVLDGAGAGQISIGRLRIWKEAAAIGPVKTAELAREQVDEDAGLVYQLVFTPRNVDIFRDMRLVASVPTPYAPEQVQKLRFAGGFDTLIVFHDHVPTQLIQRLGSDTEWTISDAPYENVPNLEPGMVFSGNLDEVQELSLAGISSGDVFALQLGDYLTQPITFGVAGTLPSQLATALAALPGVASGAADLTVTVLDGTPRVRIAFTGENGARAWPLVSAIPVASANCAPFTTVITAGVDADGPQFGATTGWPRCGAVIQARVLVAGFRAAPTTYRASQNGSLWNHAVSDPLLATDSFKGSLDVDSAEIISEVFSGRHIQFFTTGGEYYLETRVLTAEPERPINVVRTTSHGIADAVPVVFADGATIFTQIGGDTLRDYLFVEAEQSYTAAPLTLLGPQVVKGVIDVSALSARSVTDGNQLFMVNSDGTAGVLTFLRNQEVAAASPWTTAGLFRAVSGAEERQLYAVIERGGELYLELWTPDMPLDWATRFTGSALTSVAVPYLATRTDVWVMIGGDVYGPLTVPADGVLSLPASGDVVVVGLLPEWRLRLHPLREMMAEGQKFAPPGRIYEIELALADTGQIAVATNGKPGRDLPLMRFGAAFPHGGPLQTATGGQPGLPLMERLYTGTVRAQGLTGWSEQPFVELSRQIPAPVHVKSIRYDVSHRGG